MNLLQHALMSQFLFSPVKKDLSTCLQCPCGSSISGNNRIISAQFSRISLSRVSQRTPIPSSPRIDESRGSRLKASKIEELLKLGEGDDEEDDESTGSKEMNENEDSFIMNDDERKEWRRKIREVMNKMPDVEEEMDLVEKRKRMQKLLAEYPLVVDEEDPDWPEDADGWGFNLGQFFNKISIKNVKKDDDDEDYDSDKEIVWQDDDYIRPIKDITTADWEEAVYKDFSPLVVLVHNRYKSNMEEKYSKEIKIIRNIGKHEAVIESLFALFVLCLKETLSLVFRPKENEKIRDELEKAVHIIWNCRLPSPRCVAIDAVVELDLVSALQVSAFPELIFTKAGKILYREKGMRTADELSKLMAFYYYGAAKPPFLSDTANLEEAIPTIP